MTRAMELHNVGQGLPNDGKFGFKDNALEEDNVDRSTFCSTTMPTLLSFPTLSELPDMLEDNLTTPLITNKSPAPWRDEQTFMPLSSEQSHAGLSHIGYKTKNSFNSLDAVRNGVTQSQQYSLSRTSFNTEFGSGGGENSCSLYFMGHFNDVVNARLMELPRGDMESFEQVEGQPGPSSAMTRMVDIDTKGRPKATVFGNVSCHSLTVETDDEDPPRLCDINYGLDYGDWMEDSESVSRIEDQMLSELPREEPHAKSKFTWHKSEKGFNGFHAVKKEEVQVSRRLKYVMKPSDSKMYHSNLSTDLVKPRVVNNMDSVDATVFDEEFKGQIIVDSDYKEADKMYERLYAHASWEKVHTLKDIPSAGHSDNELAEIKAVAVPFGNELAEMTAMAGAPGRALRKRRPSAFK